MEFANLAAGVVVGKIGSATATLEEIEEYKSSLHKSNIHIIIKVENMTWNSTAYWRGAHHTKSGGDDIYVIIPFTIDHINDNLVNDVFVSNITGKDIQDKL